MKFRLSMILLISSAFWVKLCGSINMMQSLEEKKKDWRNAPIPVPYSCFSSNVAIVLLFIFSLLGFCFQVGHCSLSKELYFFYVAGKENFHQMHVRDFSTPFVL